MTEIDTRLDKHDYPRIVDPADDTFVRTPLELRHAFGVFHRMLPYTSKTYELVDVVPAIREVIRDMRPTSREHTHMELWGQPGVNGVHGKAREAYDGELPDHSFLERSMPLHAYALAGTYSFDDGNAYKWANPNYVHDHTYPEPEGKNRERWLRVHAELAFTQVDTLDHQFGLDPFTAAEEAAERIEWLDPDESIISQCEQRLGDTLCLYAQWSAYDDPTVRDMLADAFGVETGNVNRLIDVVADDRLRNLPDPSESPSFGNTYRN